MPPAESAFRSSPSTLGVLVAAVWAAALTGGALGIGTLLAGDRERSAAPLPQTTGDARFAVGDRIPTSYGSASVGEVVRLTGRRDALALRIAGDQRAFQVPVTVTNVRRRPVVVAASSMTLRPADRISDLQIAAGSAPGGRVAPLSSHRFAIRFVVPASGPLPTLALRDPRTGRLSTVALGGAAGAPTMDVGAHHGYPRTGARER